MKCPLIMIGIQAWSVLPPKGEADCLGVECAWFYVTGECCTILTLARASASMLSVLKSLESKTPLGGAK